LVWRGAVGAGHVEDDLGRLGVFLFGDGGEGAEELVGDVGEDGGAAGGNFVLGEEEEKAGEEIVDLGGGGKVVEVGGEGGSNFGRIVLICLKRRVSRAEVGVGVGGVETASPTVGKAIGAASGVVDEAGVSRLLGHLVIPLRDRIWKKQGATQEVLKTRELRKKQLVS
jgi:hypothetical protein